MNRRFTTVAGIVLAVALAYPATSWYLGKQIESTLDAHLHKQLSAAPYIKLVRNEYDRRLFDATQTVTIEFPAALFTQHLNADSLNMAMEKNNASATPKPADEGSQANQDAGRLIQLTTTTDIKHGPLPGFKTLGAASAELTRISFDEETQKIVDTAFSGKPPLTMSTVFGFTGGGHGVAHIAAFRYSAPNEDGNGEQVFSGDAMEARIDFARDLKRYSMTGKAPRIEITNEAKMLISGIAFSSNVQRVFDDDPLLYSGKEQVTIERIEITAENAKEAQPVQMKNFVTQGEISAPGEFLDMIGKIGIEELKIDEQNYGPVHYDVSAHHLNARKVSAFYRSAQEVYKNMLLKSAPPSLELFQPILASMQDLSLDNAELSVDRLSFNTPRGETRINSKIKLNDATKDDWYNPLILIGKLDLTADLNVPEALLNDLLTSTVPGNDGSGENQVAPARQQAIRRQLEQFVAQGYIARTDDGLLKSKIEFRAGKLTFNDKPFNLLGSLPR